nr:3-hydroxyacyl-CoA dehydrogenase family protein [Streptomyces nodosus]
MPPSDDIDAAMKLGGGYPMGPFELLEWSVSMSRWPSRRCCTGSSATRVSPRTAPGTPGGRGLPRPQDRPRFPRIRRTLTGTPP